MSASALSPTSMPTSSSHRADAGLSPPDRVLVSAQNKSLQADARTALLQQLKQRDAAVHAHEQAHLAAAGDLAIGGASYTYELGPDGHSYAIGADISISINVSAGNTPEETIGGARQVRAAALAPADN